MSNFNSTLWLSMVIQNLINNAGVVQTLNYRFDRAGKEKIVVPVLSGSLTAITDGSDITFTDPTKTAIDLELNMSANLGYTLKRKEDILDTNAPLAQALAKQAADTVTKSVDLQVIKKIILGTKSANRVTTTTANGGTASTSLTYEMLLYARKTLNAANAPQENRYLLVGSDFEADLWKIKDDSGNSMFIAYDKVNSDVSNGKIGKIMGFEVMLYNDMPLVDSNGVLTGTLNKKVALFYQSGVAAFAGEDEIFMSEPYYNQAKKYWQHSLEYTFGATTLFNGYSVTVRDA